jgi:hypothetical protein
MAMHPDEIVDLLTIISANDGRDFGDTDVTLWLQMIGQLARDDALDAILAHFAEYPNIWLTPGHVTQRVKAMVRDRIERMDPDERAAAVGPPAVRRDRYGYIDKSAPDPEPYPADWTAEQRVAAYWNQLRTSHREPPPPAPQELPWFDPFSMPPCPDCGSTRPCSCHELDVPVSVHPEDAKPLASPEHIRRCRAWLAQHQAAKVGAPIPPVETAGLSPLSVACPFCKVPAGQRCVNPRPGNAHEPFRGWAHPSRLEAVGVDDKAQAGARQVLVERAREAAPAMAMTPEKKSSAASAAMDTSAARGKEIFESGVHEPPPGAEGPKLPPIPGGGYRDEKGLLHFPDTDALDAKWAERYESVFGKNG